MPRGRKAAEGSLEGLDALVAEIGRRLGESLGAALVSGIGTGVQRAGGLEGVLRPRPRAVDAGSPCTVPACVRRAVAKGLCATHYRKARRLNLPEPFEGQTLAELAEDGRKTRFAKKA